QDTMRSVILPALLLVMLASAAEVQGEVKVVKLCGREFIRAVIYTCGSSRWRRILNEKELMGLASDNTDNLETLGYRELAEPVMGLRTRRDLNQLLTTACCQWGCNKKDLSSLC
ncbi:REL3 protein, partial [Atractosteus spatula]|nr:REL3 protein [Atractosteus spatula]